MKFAFSALTFGCVVCLWTGGLTAVARHDKPATEKLPSAVSSQAVEDLPSGAVRRFGSTRYRVTGQIENCVLSADGKTLAIHDTSPWIRLVETETGKEIRRFALQDSGSPHIKLIPRSHNRIVNSGAEGINLWDFEGRLVKVIKLPYHDILNARSQITDDGRLLMVVGNEDHNAITVVNLDEGKVVGRLVFPDTFVVRPTFFPKGDRIATYEMLNPRKPDNVGKPDCRIRIWDVATGKLVNVIGSEDFTPEHVKIAPDGTKIAVYGECATKLWDIRGKLIQETNHKRGSWILPAFSFDSVLFASHLSDESVVVRRMNTDDTKKSLITIPRDYSQIQFTSDGRLLSIRSDGAALEITEPVTGKRYSPVGGHSDAVSRLHFVDDRNVLFSLGKDDRLIRWDGASGVEQAEPFPNGTKALRSLAANLQNRRELWAEFSPNGRYVVLGDPAQTGFTLAWDTESGSEVIDLVGGGWTESSPKHVRFSADSTTAFAIGPCYHSASIDQLRSWDLETGQASPTQTYCSNREATAFDVAPGGKAAVIACNGLRSCDRELREVWYWNFNSSKGSAITIPGIGERPRLHFINDRQFAIMADHCEPFMIYDAVQGAKIRELEGPRWWAQLGTTSVSSVSRDHRFLAANLDIGYDSFGEQGGGPLRGQLIVWELASGTIRNQFTIPDVEITAITFSAEGRYVFSGLSDSTILQWDLGKPAEKVPPLDATALARHWENLAAPSAAAADRSARILTERSAESVPFFAERLKPTVVDKIKAERIQKFIADLDSDRFAVRESASKELAAIGLPAVEAAELTLAKTKSAEVRHRLEKFLDKALSAEIPPHLIRPLRAIQILEWTGNDAAIAVLKNLAKGGDSPQTQAAADSLKRLEAKKRR